MNNRILIEKIEAWLDDYLPEDEAAILQEKAETDSEFRALVEHVQARRSVVEAHQAAYYLKKIDVWKAPSEPAVAPASQVINLGKIALIAVVLLLTAGLTYWVFTHPVERKENPGTVAMDKSTEGGDTNGSFNVPESTPHDSIPAKVSPTMGKSHVSKPRPNHREKSLFKFFPAQDSVRIDTAYRRPADSLKIVNNVYALVEIPVENELEKALAITRARGGNLQGSSYKQGLELAKTDPDGAIPLLASIDVANGFYLDAQKILAFLYAGKGLYHEAALCYKRYDSGTDTPESNWQLAGFYLKDYKNSQNDLLKLLDEIIDTKGGHEYKNEADLLKRRLKE
ncbi:MAG: hypothetical protein KDC61_03045 [Saprospiraceae bacterium]|nr:hypothetical protein [Saprospiraceae bacterium]